MKLTDDKLKELIIQVMEDLGLLMPLPLDAEPKGNEDPPVLKENSSLEQKLFYLLSKMLCQFHPSFYYYILGKLMA